MKSKCGRENGIGMSQVTHGQKFILTDSKMILVEGQTHVTIFLVRKAKSKHSHSLG